MRSIGIALILSVNLGGGFGTASAEIVSYSDEGMVVRIQVEVEVSAESVVAHLQAPGEPELTIPMLSQGGGLYEIQTDLPPIDYQVVFEALGSPGAVSSSNSLSALGAEFPEDPDTTAAGGEGDESDSSGWGWLALALAAASLSALAFWVLGGSDEEDESPGDDVEEPGGDDDISDDESQAGETD